MNVDLPLTNVDKKPDGCPENDRSNAGPEDCPLAHRAGLGRRVEDEIGTIKGGAVGDQPVDGVDFPVSGGVLFRSVPALGDDFTSNAVDDDRSERSLRHLGCQGDGLSHDWFNGKVETCFNCSGLEILKKSSIGHLKGILKKLS